MKKCTRTVIWRKAMELGKRSGCHQMPERSFFYKGKQFPVCARCTGVLIGYVVFILICFFFIPDIRIGMICCYIMFADWFVQYLKIKQSTNIRRLITGIIGGFGTVLCETQVVIYFIKFIIKGITNG